ncbi:hypothetical protein A4X13_0g6704 [Tilletia indica]|uniref:Uncharacterized protein n=1 Tax=Tilletia indica TaxID=43049 RepID=A0A177T6P6_9BASI|nr:hypothetical protein A4X13_0g6704 [Tilletia indica]
MARASRPGPRAFGVFPLSPAKTNHAWLTGPGRSISSPSSQFSSRPHDQPFPETYGINFQGREGSCYGLSQGDEGTLYRILERSHLRQVLKKTRIKDGVQYWRFLTAIEWAELNGAYRISCAPCNHTRFFTTLKSFKKHLHLHPVTRPSTGAAQCNSPSSFTDPPSSNATIRAKHWNQSIDLGSTSSSSLAASARLPASLAPPSKNTPPSPHSHRHITSSSIVAAPTPSPPSKPLTKDHHHQNSISPPSSSVSSSASSSRRAHVGIDPSATSTAAGGDAGNGAIKGYSHALAEHPPPSISLITPCESPVIRYDVLPSTNAYDCSSPKSGHVSPTSSSTLDSEDDDWEDVVSSSDLESEDDDGDDIVAAGGPAVDHRGQRARQRALAERKVAQLVRDWQKFDAAHTRCRSLVKDMLLRGRLACKLSLGPDEEEIVEEVRREEEAAEEKRMELMDMERKRGTRVLHPVEMEERRERKNGVAAAAVTTATATGAATGPVEGSAEQVDLSTESQTGSSASEDTRCGVGQQRRPLGC